MSKNLVIIEIDEGAVAEVHHYGLGDVEVIQIDWSDMEVSAYNAHGMLETLAGASQGALGLPPPGLDSIKARLQNIIDEEAEDEEDDDDGFEFEEEDDDEGDWRIDDDNDEPIDLADEGWRGPPAD